MSDTEQFEQHLQAVLAEILPENPPSDDSYLPTDRLGEIAARAAREAWRRWWTERLTVTEAATWSGFSADWIYEQIREGKLPDPRPTGSQGRVWVRRCDLPRRPALHPGRPAPKGMPEPENEDEEEEEPLLAGEILRRR